MANNSFMSEILQVGLPLRGMKPGGNTGSAASHLQLSSQDRTYSLLQRKTLQARTDRNAHVTAAQCACIKKAASLPADAAKWEGARACDRANCSHRPMPVMGSTAIRLRRSERSSQFRTDTRRPAGKARKQLHDTMCRAAGLADGGRRVHDRHHRRLRCDQLIALRRARRLLVRPGDHHRRWRARTCRVVGHHHVRVRDIIDDRAVYIGG